MVRQLTSLTVLLLAGGLLSGCSWNPIRDNTTDPGSPYYRVPPQENRQPSIDTVFMVFDCLSDPQNDFCGFDLVSRISDPDRNIDLNTVVASIEMEAGNWEMLGQMIYDPRESWYIITKSQDDFPSESLDLLTGKSVRVDVQDDSNATDSYSIIFLDPINDAFPNVTLAPDNLDPLPTNHPHLLWEWPITGDDHTFSVSVRSRYNLPIWDTTGLGPSADSVIVTDSIPANNFDGGWYLWFVTVRDARGNRLTSEPGEFKILLPEAVGTDRHQLVIEPNTADDIGQEMSGGAEPPNSSGLRPTRGTK